MGGAGTDEVDGIAGGGSECPALSSTLNTTTSDVVRHRTPKMALRVCLWIQCCKDTLSFFPFSKALLKFCTNRSATLLEAGWYAGLQMCFTPLFLINV